MASTERTSTIWNTLLSANTKGDIAEYKAIIALLEQGLEVYRNVTSDGPADLVTLDRKTGEIQLVDVKQLTKGRSNGRSRTREQRMLGVKLLYVGDEVRWSAANDNEPREDSK